MSPERAILLGWGAGLLAGIAFIAWLSSQPVQPTEQPVNINEAGEWWFYETRLQDEGCTLVDNTKDEKGKLRRAFKCPDGTTRLGGYI